MNNQNTKLNLRKAKKQDLPFVLEVQETAMSPATIKVHGSWNHNLQKENTNEDTISTYEVVSIDGKDIGALQVFEKENVLEFERLYILPAEQSKGFGSLVMNEILERASKLGKKEINFKVYKINERAINLYKKKGCKVVGELDLHFEMSYYLLG